MKYKYKAKTRKNRQAGGFERVLYNQIENLTDQNELACILKENATIQNFIKDIFWDILVLIKKNNNTDYKKIIRENILQKTTPDKIITQIGYEPEQINEIINKLENNKKQEFLNLSFLTLLIHKTTSCLSTLNNSSFQSMYIRHDEELFSEFITKIKNIFNLPDNFDKNDFNSLYEGDGNKSKSNKYRKENFDRLVVKVLHTSSKQGVIQLNYGRESFTRKDRLTNYVKKSDKIPKCFEDLKDENIQKIYGVTNYLDTSNTFTESIFKFYNKEILGGVSGSAYYFYFLITRILKKKINKDLLTKILCVVIIDYVPLWHNLEEILLTYSIEYKSYGFSEYKINENPIEYLKNIINSSANENEKKGEVSIEAQEKTPIKSVKNTAKNTTKKIEKKEADEKVADEKVADKKVADEKVADEKVAEKKSGKKDSDL
jgi:hypothetical protein